MTAKKLVIAQLADVVRDDALVASFGGGNRPNSQVLDRPFPSSWAVETASAHREKCDSTPCWVICEAEALVPRASAENHLPPELASQILERESRALTPKLEPAVRELLTCLAEECGEVVQRCTKILRFGLRENPWTGRHNKDTLTEEVGDLFAVVELLYRAGTLDRGDVAAACVRKVRAFGVDDGRLRAAREVAK